MAKNSKIEWTDHTVNLWWGCSKVHTGCKNCYAETLSNRFGDNVWGETAPRKRIKSAFKDLARYQREAAEKNVYAKVFVGSMMDIFEESKPLSNPIDGDNTTSDLRCRFFAEIEVGSYPNLIFLFLTKRPENIEKMLPAEIRHSPNLWFGTSVSDEKTAEHLNVLAAQPVQNRFVSVEPQVELIRYWSLLPGIMRIDWLIQGGESGRRKRPFDVKWAYIMKEMCEALDIPYFFKQIDKVQEIPADLNVRQFPTSFSEKPMSKEDFNLKMLMRRNIVPVLPDLPDVGYYDGIVAAKIFYYMLYGLSNTDWKNNYRVRGIFEEGDLWIAFDNSSKDFWVEEFADKESAVAWAMGEEVQRT